MVDRFEKIIIRNKMINEDDLKKQTNLTSLEDYIQLVEQNAFSLPFLQMNYNEVLNKEINNEYFITAYKLKDEMAIAITEHIYLYKIIQHDPHQHTQSWYYADEKLYIADSWWETDDEILEDVHTLSFVEFFIKYKAYGWFQKLNQ